MRFVDRFYRALAIYEHDDFLGDLGVDDVFDTLRTDPRMTKLLKQIGLPTQP